MVQSDWEECQISHMSSLKSAGREETFQRFGRLLTNNGIQHGFESDIRPAETTPVKKASTPKPSFIDENEIATSSPVLTEIDADNPRLQRGRTKPTSGVEASAQPKTIMPARSKPR